MILHNNLVSERGFYVIFHRDEQSHQKIMMFGNGV